MYGSRPDRADLLAPIAVVVMGYFPETMAIRSFADKKRCVIALVLSLALSACYVSGRGYLESNFELILENRLPKFFDPGGHISPAGYKARVEYYSSPESVRVIIYDPSRHKVFDKQDKYFWHPMDDREHPAAHYPNHVVVSFEGAVDILEQRRAEPLEYLSDDKALWDALKRNP
jgi:hypothetical protein